MVRRISGLFVIALWALLFITDLAVNNSLATVHSFLVATFLYALIEVETPWWQTILLVLSTMLESFLVTGIFGQELVVIIPLGVGLSLVRQRVDVMPFIDALFSVSCAFFTLKTFSFIRIDSLLLLSFHYIIALIVVYYRER